MYHIRIIAWTNADNVLGVSTHLQVVEHSAGQSMNMVFRQVQLQQTVLAAKVVGGYLRQIVARQIYGTKW